MILLLAIGATYAGKVTINLSKMLTFVIITDSVGDIESKANGIYKDNRNIKRS